MLYCVAYAAYVLCTPTLDSFHTCKNYTQFFIIHILWGRRVSSRETRIPVCRRFNRIPRILGPRIRMKFGIRVLRHGIREYGIRHSRIPSIANNVMLYSPGPISVNYITDRYIRHIPRAFPDFFWYSIIITSNLDGKTRFELQNLFLVLILSPRRFERLE